MGAGYDTSADLWAVGCVLGELIDGKPVFPGENDLDQLSLISRSLGIFPSFLRQKLLESGRGIVRYSESKSLESRYRGKVPNEVIDLLKMLLSLDKNDRPTAIESLSHPFFQELISQETSSDISILHLDLNFEKEIRSFHETEIPRNFSPIRNNLMKMNFSQSNLNTKHSEIYGSVSYGYLKGTQNSIRKNVLKISEPSKILESNFLSFHKPGLNQLAKNLQKSTTFRDENASSSNRKMMGETGSKIKSNSIMPSVTRSINFGKNEKKIFGNVPQRKINSRKKEKHIFDLPENKTSFRSPVLPLIHCGLRW